jgi:hypothetical protein
MKVKYFIISIFLFIAFLSCTKEPALDSDISVTYEPERIIENSEITFFIEGEAEFITFFPGTEDRIYDSLPFHQGITVTGDEHTYKYPNPGNYEAVFVATSYGNWGEDMNRKVVRIPIEVLEEEE